MINKKIKLISGWSNPGGSTVHHIDLTNALCSRGYDCTFYGPHNYHLDKCKSGLITDAAIDPNDIIISHFIRLPSIKENYKHILSCHETNLFPLKRVDLNQYDTVHFVSKFQRDWHNVKCNDIIIPGFIQQFEWSNPNNNVAGVVGSLDSHKRPHLSIERALQDGFKLVKLFGNITEPEYYNTFCKKYIEKNQAIYMGYVDRVAAYNQVEKVYTSSKRESCSLVQGECLKAGIPFEGLPENERDINDYIFDNNKIVSLWEGILND